MRMVLLTFSSLTLLLSASVSADGNHKHEFAKDVHVFHERLSPLWHAPSGPDRASNVCKAAPDLATLSGSIKSADASKLSQSIDVLQKHCANGSADIEQSFSTVHDAFHALIGEHD